MTISRSCLTSAWKVCCCGDAVDMMGEFRGRKKPHHARYGKHGKRDAPFRKRPVADEKACASAIQRRRRRNASAPMEPSSASEDGSGIAATPGLPVPAEEVQLRLLPVDRTQ